MQSGSFDEAGAIAYLRSPLAIRARCENVLAAGLAGTLDHFAIELDRLDAVADRVATVTRAAYPDLAIPVHGRMGYTWELPAHYYPKRALVLEHACGTGEEQSEPRADLGVEE